MGDNNPRFISYVSQPTDQIWSFLAVTLLILGVGIYYYFSLKKLNGSELPKGLAFLVMLYVDWIRETTRETLGKRYESYSWYFIYLFTLLWTSNLISIAGIETLGSSFTVPLSLGIITFLFTFYFGIKHQKLSYYQEYISRLNFNNKFKIYFPDPFKWIGKLSRIFSLIFRYWGNMFAGSLIIGALYELIVNNLLNANLGYLGVVLTGFVSAPLRMYFDILPGLIQPLIFMLLTLSYWSSEANLSEADVKYLPEKMAHKKYFTSFSLVLPEYL
ncbi:F0F1 ATP synthase, F0 complex subunit A [[Mycoplasma] cavipharyngis]|uniref:FoF1 ATP synthase subunit A n=1 Tax=[Mycoplasma] cavipharyngis TaxID=92757 RepID=UPI0037037716